MERTVTGIVAHVDAGKTTLTEALLYKSGAIRTLGRVDHKNAFLDTDPMERERGITIFSKSAVLPAGKGREIILLDTPGHVDFSAETERVLRVLDCAIIVISAADGVQSHTLTLWRLLKRYGIPAFFFVNKMDLAGADRERALRDLKERLDGGCVDFSADAARIAEEAALCDEALLERYLDSGSVSDADLRNLIAARKLFPCFFGSALKLEGIAEFLERFARYAPVPAYPAEFGARIFKISRGEQGKRLAWMKITGGSLKVKTPLTNRRQGEENKAIWEEKADQIRLYSGAKYQTAEQVPAGTVCAVTGLSRAQAGEGLGFESDWAGPVLEPALSCQVIPEGGADIQTVLECLRRLEEEDPQLRVVWNRESHTAHVRLMGEVQLEILRRVLEERCGVRVSFGEAAVVYRETIAKPVEGIGHFEPLRHYAEVHLLLEPLPGGSGLVFASACPEDALARAWQRLVLTHLAEKEHVGVLTGSPLTDMKITLIAGRAHEKHTEGGDFREATYRAVRQGLMEAESILLEPWYAFRLEVPAKQAGRALNDLRFRNAESDPPQINGGEAVLTGGGPVATLKGYAKEVRAYTGGLGRFHCQSAGFRPCADQEGAVAAIGYDPDRDLENPSSSVFCSHGAGVLVPWDRVPASAHIAPFSFRETSGLARPPAAPPPSTPPKTGTPARMDYAGTMEEDERLRAIFERTYGPTRQRRPERVREARTEAAAARHPPPARSGPEYLLVDGYNIIFAWDELTAAARENLDASRKALCDLLCEYQGTRGCVVIVVFDAYKVKGNPGSHEKYHNIHVVYTKEAETADAYIERATYEIGKGRRVRVATSDGPEQLIILGHGALRVSASMFREELDAARVRIREVLEKNNRQEKNGAFRAAIEKALREARVD